MSFIETPRFPEGISYGATAIPVYETDVKPLEGGDEQRTILRDRSLSRYEIQMPLVEANKDSLIAWFHGVRGRGHGFRMKDWSDYRVTQAQSRLGSSANGAGIPTYQLRKIYVVGSLTQTRNIRKPVTVAIYRGGVLQTAGASAGNYAVDTTTGIVTFVADGSQNVSSVTISGTPVVTLASAISGLGIGGRLYITGVVGTAGNVLNGVAHTITNVSTNQYTIGTSTTGLAYTSGGTGFKYPQPSEALTWAGEFDVPVRFDTDELPLTVEARSETGFFYRAQQLSLQELKQ